MKDISKTISVTSRRNQIFFSEKLKPLGITSAQFMYIVSICEKAGQTQDELSQEIMIDKSAVAKTLSSLEASGFIERKVNPDDKRAFNVYPTYKAHAIYPMIVKLKAEWHEMLLEGLSELECEIFEKLMAKVMYNSTKHYK